MSASHAPPPERETGFAPIAVDGLFAGLLGAAAVGIAFLIFDAARGVPLHTPSVLGATLFQGAEAARGTTTDVGLAYAFNGVHVLLFVAGGLLASYVASLVERHPRYWYLAFTGLAFALAAVVYVDAALGVTGLGTLRLSAAALLGSGVVVAYLLWRHPEIRRHLNDVWED